MLRAVGAGLVLGASALWGLGKIRLLARKRDDLLSVIGALQYISAELSYCAAPLEDILRRVPDCPLFVRISDSLRRDGFQNPQGVWKMAVESERSVKLGREARRELARLGETLGRFPANEQLSALHSCISRLEEQEKRAEAKAAQGRKLYMGLALSAGAMLCAVLI